MEITRVDYSGVNWEAHDERYLAFQKLMVGPPVERTWDKIAELLDCVHAIDDEAHSGYKLINYTPDHVDSAILGRATRLVQQPRYLRVVFLMDNQTAIAIQKLPVMRFRGAWDHLVWLLLRNACTSHYPQVRTIEIPDEPKP